jgi:hypothetical protein
VRRWGALAAALAWWAPSGLPAQLALEVSAGARYTTPLVRDAIVTPFDVRPALAPALAVSITTPLKRGWGAVAVLDASTSDLTRRSDDGSTVSLGRLTTAALSVGVERRIAARVTARLAVGGLKYLPADDRGIFRSGSAIAPLGSVTLTRALSVGGGKRLALEARYDVHGFTTPALRDEGFDGTRSVHRITVALRARFGVGR